jgi:hypothetical protein
MAQRDNAAIATNINIGTGVWLVIAPFVLGYAALQAPLWNDIVCGALIVVLAGIRRSNISRNEGLSYVNAGIGAWLIIAPWILAYGDYQPAIWNDVAVGILVLIMGIWSASATRDATRTPGA